jgi:hypothetical protein
MGRRQPFEIGLHALRQRVIGRILAGKQRVAANRRHRVEIKDARRRRLLIAGDVRMPVLAVDAPGLGVGMDRQDLGMSVRPGRAGMNVQFTEVAPEALVRVDIHRLVAKEQHLVLRQRVVQLLDLAVAEWLGEREACDLGADARRYRRDLDGFIAHGVTFRRWSNLEQS